MGAESCFGGSMDLVWRVEDPGDVGGLEEGVMG